jgi:hypothetical protein
VSRLFLLLGLSWRTRMRGVFSAGASSVFLVLGGLFYLAVTCAMGLGAYFVLSQSRGARLERVADLASLVVTMFGVFFLIRPLILTNLSGASLQNLLHLPIRRGELLLYSLITGVFMPLLLESPVFVGAALGAAARPGRILLTLPLALLSHLVLLMGAHAMSLLAVLIARRTWIADAARVAAFSLFFLPSLVSYRGPREFLRPLLEPLVSVSPLGFGPRAVIHAGAGDLGRSLAYALPAGLLLLGIAFVSMTLLNRILAGEGQDRVEKEGAEPRRARVWLPGALGAMIETQLRTQLRTPAARMALFFPTLMMGFFAFTLSQQRGAGISPLAIVVFLSLVGGNAFLTIGRGVALILGTPVARAWMLVASDVSGFLFRMPPLLAIVAVTAWRAGWETALPMIALVLALVPISMGVQHFVSILRPFALPRDRFNPYAQRVDARQSSNGFVSLLATLATGLIAAPFLVLLWLSSRIAEGLYAQGLAVLACLGALAAYAVLIAIAERLFISREMRLLEVLLDDSPG